MESLQLFLLIVQVVVAVLMIVAVLLQKSDGDSLSGIGGGSGGMNSVMSSKASANLLTKITMVLIAIFMLNCLVLALISSKLNRTGGKLQIDNVIQESDSTKTDQESDATKTDNTNPDSSDKKSPTIPPIQ